MTSKVENRATGYNIHFGLENIVPDNQVNLAYFAKDPALPENTIEITDYTINIPENVERFNSWQKFPVKSEAITVDRAIYDGASVLGNPSGVVNDDFPFAGWRREAGLVLTTPPHVEIRNVYISSKYFYETTKQINFSALRLHIHASGDMPDGYVNPGENYQAYIYDPTIELQIVSHVPPVGTTYLHYHNFLTLERKEDGTHNGQYIIPMDNSRVLPSGSMIQVNCYTRSAPEIMTINAGYVLFLGISNYGSQDAINFLNQTHYDMSNYYTQTDPNAFPFQRDCSDSLPPGFVYLRNLTYHACGHTESVPNIDILSTVSAGNSDYTLHYIDVDVDGNKLPLHPLMGQVDLQLTNKSLEGNIPSRSAKPLSWQYILRYDHEIKSDDPENSIQITDENGDTISSNLYKVVKLEKFDTNATNRNIYKIKLLLPDELARQPGKTYRVRYNKYLNGQVQTNFVEVINPISTSRPKLDYHIDYGYSDFRISFSAAGSLADVTPETLGKNYVWGKMSDKITIRIGSPVAGPYHAWYPRVHRGAFRKYAQTVETSTGKLTKDIIYYTPEFRRQPCAVNWAKRATELAASGNPQLDRFIQEPVHIENPTTLRTRHKNVYFWESDKGSPNGGNFAHDKYNWPNYIPPRLHDWNMEGGSLNLTPSQFSASKHSHGINIYKNNNVMSNDIIQDWDYFNGKIFLNTPIDFDDKIEVSYLAEQEWIVGRTLDINPTNNRDNANQINKTIRVVLKPHWDTYTEDTHDPSPSGYKLAWHYLDDNDTGVYNAIWNAFGVLKDGTTGYDFTRPNTTVGLPDGTLIIGDISIREHGISATNILDARVRGGGIKEDKWFVEQDQKRTRRKHKNLNARQLRQKESKYYWDIGYWDGEPYQGDSVLVIQIPLSKRTDFHDKIVEDNIGQTNIRPTERALVDGYYNNNGSYNYTAITDGITDTNILTAIREYIDLQLESWLAADQEIRRIIDKYIAFGTFYVIMDETGTLWPQIESSATRVNLR